MRQIWRNTSWIWRLWSLIDTEYYCQFCFITWFNFQICLSLNILESPYAFLGNTCFNFYWRSRRIIEWLMICFLSWVKIFARYMNCISGNLIGDTFPGNFFVCWPFSQMANAKCLESIFIRWTDFTSSWSMQQIQLFKTFSQLSWRSWHLEILWINPLWFIFRSKLFGHLQTISSNSTLVLNLFLNPRRRAQPIWIYRCLFM